MASPSGQHDKGIENMAGTGVKRSVVVPSFDEFIGATSVRWRRMAGTLWRRYRTMIPKSWYELADVYQDILLGVWIAYGQYDATRGVSLENYVAWGAKRFAVKRILKESGVEQHRRLGGARFDIAAAFVGEWVFDALQHIEDVEDRSDLRTAAEMVCSNMRELIALRAVFSEGSFEGAARRMVANDGITCRVSIPEQAEKLAVRTVKAVIQRLEVAEVV